MATPAQWLEGARPRTLPAAVAPVLAGTGVAAYVDSVVAWKAALALVVALALQVGVNYANDYSDGVRGTDEDRVGPLRLVGSGVATPGAVKRAAFAAFGVAAVTGLVLAATTRGGWWRWGRSASWRRGSTPAGRAPTATAGSARSWCSCSSGWSRWSGRRTSRPAASGAGGRRRAGGAVALGDWLPASLLAAVGIGAIACAILVANNLRDIPTDAEVGKRTLAVVLGDARTRLWYVALLGPGRVAAVGVALVTSPWALLALVALVPGVRAVAVVRSGAVGRDLVPVLQLTGVTELLYGLGLFLGLLLA